MEEITVIELECLYPDCRHKWRPRTDHKPKVCPKCKRYDWDKPYMGTRAKGGAKHVRGPRSLRKQSSLIERFKREHESKEEDTTK